MKTAVWKSKVSFGMTQVVEYKVHSVVPLICGPPLALASCRPLAPLGWKSRPALAEIFSDFAQTLIFTVWPRYFWNSSTLRLCRPHHTNEYGCGASVAT